MPERPYRLAELRAHSMGRYATAIDPERDRIIAEHPDWSLCSACRYPVDPASGGTSVHPNCITDTTAGAEPADQPRRRS